MEPKANPVFSLYKFHNRVQGEVETVEQFLTDLKLLARDCAFKEPDEMIRNRIVFATNSHKIREKLINVGKVYLSTKLLKLQEHMDELPKAQLKSMESSSEVVHGISEGQRYRKKSSKTPSKERTQSCGKCGTIHAKAFCPAVGKTCL